MAEENQQLKSFTNEQDAQEWMFNVELEDENRCTCALVYLNGSDAPNHIRNRCVGHISI